jgi:hypothetical protein
MEFAHGDSASLTRSDCGTMRDTVIFAAFFLLLIIAVSCSLVLLCLEMTPRRFPPPWSVWHKLLKAPYDDLNGEAFLIVPRLKHGRQTRQAGL